MDKEGERSFETMADEFYKAASMNFCNNMKRTYDEYQHESLESIRRNRTHVDVVLSDAQKHSNTKENIANQSLQNAVETANMIAKQAVRHSDIAIDRQWNVDEVAQLVAKTPVFLDAISAAVAKAVTVGK